MDHTKSDFTSAMQKVAIEDSALKGERLAVEVHKVLRFLYLKVTG